MLLSLTVVITYTNIHNSILTDVDNSKNVCTLKLTEQNIKHRLYGRLWKNKTYWNAWNNAGADTIRRIRQPSWFNKGDIVIDVGSNIGTDLINLLGKKVDITIHTYEPVQKFVNLLYKRIDSFDNKKNLIIHPFGLGKNNRTTCFKHKSAATFESDVCDSYSNIVDVEKIIKNFSKVDLM